MDQRYNGLIFVGTLSGSDLLYLRRNPDPCCQTFLPVGERDRNWRNLRGKRLKAIQKWGELKCERV
jgi:hypothetical protein